MTTTTWQSPREQGAGVQKLLLPLSILVTHLIGLYLAPPWRHGPAHPANTLLALSILPFFSHD